MKMLASSVVSTRTNEKQTTRYEVIKREIDKTWPAWKKDAYNNNFATSAHAKKVEVLTI